MKQIVLTSSNYKSLEHSFREWLDILGYSARTVEGSPLQIRELFYYLEQKNITHISQIKSRALEDFIVYIKGRSNLKYGGALSNSSINTYIGSMQLFSKYVNMSGRYVLDFMSKHLSIDIEEKTILSKAEIKALYEVTYEPHATFNSLAMGQRDRAIIAIFYGCGLRKNEGTSLNIADIDLVKRLVLVKKGKGNKQRYVPIVSKHVEDIRAYLEEGRYWFMQDNKSAYHVRKGKIKTEIDTEAFFLNNKGKRMNSFYARFEYLKNKVEIETHFSTHTLRHSIATHLLQNGMPIEEIAKFLGHSSLVSTQIYTHLANGRQV